MEKLITKAKRGDTHNRRQALRVLNDRESAYILFEELAPLFQERNGGYTRSPRSATVRVTTPLWLLSPW